MALNLHLKTSAPSSPQRLGKGHWRLYSSSNAGTINKWSLNGVDWFSLDITSGSITLFDVDLWVESSPNNLNVFQLPINMFVGIGAGFYKQSGYTGKGSSIEMGSGGGVPPPPNN